MNAISNAGQAFATVAVDELARHGVTDAVLAPGSRSTPLALAFAADSRIRLHVRIDERSAAFLAVGLARATGRPVPILCTSGTATAHFHAAVLEADQSRVPLLVLTADRPPELRGVGANQTIDQVGIYGAAVRWSVDVGVPDARAESVRYWRSLISRAVTTACGGSTGAPGPVHVNVPLREPLTQVDDGVGFAFPLDGRGDGAPWTTAARAATHLPAELGAAVAGAARGVLVAGDGLSAQDVTAIVEFAGRSGWPVIAEPHSNARHPSVAVSGAEELLRNDNFRSRHRPDLVVVAGRVGLSRALLGWLSEQQYVVIDRDGLWWDPIRRASGVYRCDVTALSDVTGRATSDWAATWRSAGEAAAAAIDALLDSDEDLTEPRVARDVAAALPDGAALVAASSMPIRDLDLTMRPRAGLTVVANRGVSGIDGFVSTAQGVALAHAGPTWALAGDLSLIHDANGLLSDDPPNITYVVVNNNGGGIFSILPTAKEVEPATFERLFGTPHHVDIAALATAYGVSYSQANSAADLHAELGQTPKGIHLVEIRTDRTANAELHARLHEAATASLR